MPRGVYQRKKVTEVNVEANKNGNTDVSLPEVQGKEESPRQEVSAVSVTPRPVFEPLGPGQKYFEAPTGEVVIGDSTKDHLLWYDPKQGKRVYINPKR